MAALSKACKPDNFELHTSLKLSFMNSWGLWLNFFDCESFFESNCTDILALCKTNLDDSIDSGNFSVRGYLPLIQKDSSTHVNGLAVFVKEGLPSAQDLSLENSADSYLRFWLALLHSVSYCFFLYRSPSSSLCTDFDSISSNMVRFSWSTHLLMCLFLAIPVELIDLVNSAIISNNLSQMVNLPTCIPDCDQNDSLQSSYWFIL